MLLIVRLHDDKNKKWLFFLKRALAKLLKLEDVWIGLRKIGERYYWENGTALEMDE